jgi:hypothetical protein
VQARNDAFQMQHFHAAALSDLLRGLRSELEREPPDVETALARIRKVLADKHPAA